jgi:hypothetical protein
VDLGHAEDKKSHSKESGQRKQPKDKKYSERFAVERKNAQGNRTDVRDGGTAARNRINEGRMKKVNL